MSQPDQARLQPAIPPIAFPALLIGAIAVGASAIFVRLSELGPIPTAFYRPFLAIPALWLWVALQPAVVERRRQASARDFGLMLLGGAFFAGDLAFWHVHTLHGSGPNRSTMDRRFYINGYVTAANCDRGEWAFRDGAPCPLQGEQSLVHYEELYSNPGPMFVD